MTQLLERAITEVRKLPGPTQDAIAAFTLEQIADDRAWDEASARSQDQLARLAAKAREDIAAARPTPHAADAANSQLTEDFLACYARLPAHVRRRRPRGRFPR